MLRKKNKDKKKKIKHDSCSCGVTVKSVYYSLYEKFWKNI